YNVMKELETKIKGVPGVKGMTFSTGRSFFSGVGSNNGLAFIRLTPFNDRKKHDEMSLENITKSLYGATAGIADARVIFFSPPSVPGFGASAGFEVVLLDRAGHEIKEMNEVAQKFVGELMSRPEIEFAQTSFNTNYPQYEMVLN